MESVPLPDSSLNVLHSDTRLSLTKDDVAKPAMFDVNGVPVLFTPPNWRAEAKPELAAERFVQLQPFIIEHVVVADNDSFMSYLRRFSSEGDSTYFEAHRGAHQVWARFDYHTSDGANHNSHSLTRDYKIDDRFEAWQQISGAFITQDAFVGFLEDRIVDLSESPKARVTQAALMTTVKGFKATQTLTCNSAVNRQNGDVAVEFIKNTTERHEVLLPEVITLELPVFEFGGSYEINARLRFQLKEGKVSFKIELIRVERLIDNAFLDEVTELKALVKAPIILLA